VRWRLRIQEYDFVVRHIAGRSNLVADGLSRCFVIGEDQEANHLEDIQRVHNVVVGHHGISRSVKMLKDSGITWRGMRRDVSDFIAACPTCQIVRQCNASAAAAVSTTAVYAPFEVLAVDTIGPLPADERGN